jgi:hypothetical protein
LAVGLEVARVFEVIPLADLINRVKPYWPAVIAGLYLAYVLAAGKTESIPDALAAFVAVSGLNQSNVSAHAKLAAAEAKQSSGA